MTNKDKALALINTFATGDTDVAKIYWLKDIFSTTQELLMNLHGRIRMENSPAINPVFSRVCGEFNNKI